MVDLPPFDAEDSVTIKGRERVFSGRFRETPTFQESEIVGRVVGIVPKRAGIDELPCTRKFRIRGVQRFRIRPNVGPIRDGEDIGLLVEEVEDRSGCLITTHMMKRETAHLLGRETLDGFYWRDEPVVYADCALPGDEPLTDPDMREVAVASGGVLCRFRYNTQDQLLPIEDFSDRYLRPVVAALLADA